MVRFWHNFNVIRRITFKNCTISAINMMIRVSIWKCRHGIFSNLSIVPADHIFYQFLCKAKVKFTNFFCPLQWKLKVKNALRVQKSKHGRHYRICALKFGLERYVVTITRMFLRYAVHKIRKWKLNLLGMFISFMNTMYVQKVYDGS